MQGAGRAVPGGLGPSAYPAPVPCSAYLALQGGGPVPLSLFLAWGRSPPCGDACFCELALRAAAAAQVRPGGGASRLGVGRPGLGALPRPTARPCGVRPVPATHWLWVRGVWALGPVINPTARALASWLCARWGRPERARGGGASLAWVWRARWAPVPERNKKIGKIRRKTFLNS